LLVNIHVKNLALIDEIEIDFGEKLNILTGETGAGKSILIGSIHIALGGKILKDIVRENAEYGLVELLFQIDNEHYIQEIRKRDIPVDETGEILITRKITGSRSISKINGETVTTGVLKEVAKYLIDIHGQHEHQSLLNKGKHLEILDEFSKAELGNLKTELEKEYGRYMEIKNQIEKASIEEDQRLREISFCEFEINEIEQAGLKPGEDEELTAYYRLLSNSKKIMQVLSGVYEQTGYEGEGAAGDKISRSLRELSYVAEYENVLQDMFSQLTDIESLLNDFNRELSDYMDSLTFSEEDFFKTEKRLDEINQLKMKYGQSIEKILSYKEEKEKILDQLNHREEYLNDLKKELDDSYQKVENLSFKISEIRKKNGAIIAERIKKELIELNFLEIQFDMKFEKLNHFTKNGYDEAEFLISTNPGENLKPLGKVASGGELSRVMLAIKTVLASEEDIDTLIFDEIDVGVSGRTAQMVSQKLALISRYRQVICITHLPQIASMADSHYLIEKETRNSKTSTYIKKLSADEEIEELGRLLGGAKITDTVLKNAREMKELATSTKLT
jgi:DNA repair protein RecN (Recombination protein N)